MKKFIQFFAVLIVFSMSTSLFAQFSTVWERNSANGNLPSWFGSTTERGMAYGLVGGNDRVFVVSRSTAPIVQIMDGTTGADLGTLDATGLAGGLFLLNDVEVSDDGIIFACNLTLDHSNVSNPFKVYRWDGEASSPVTVLEFTGATGYRLGDKFSVYGSTADNSLEIWAVASTQNKVFKFTTSDQGFSFTATEITLSDAAAGSSPAAWPIGNGNFYVNGNGINPKEYEANGTLVNAVSGAVVPTGSNKLVYFEAGSRKFFVTFEYNTTSGIHKGTMVEVTDGNDNAVLYGATPNLGPNGSTGNGDVDIKDNGDGTYVVYVQASNNGLGAYETTDPVPVELTSFSASVTASGVQLTWSTATETNNNGFEIQRADESKVWTNIGFVEGKGTTSETQSYSFVDNTVQNGTFFYRLRQVDFDGSSSFSAEVGVVFEAPVSFELSQNFPNPFNPTTNIQFSIPEASNVKLVVYNLLGQEVSTLVSGYLESGVHNYTFNAQNLNSGLYIYKLEANELVATRKMMLMK